MQFKASPGSTLLLLAACLLFARLGTWQLDREQEKQYLFEQFEQAPSVSIEQALKQEEGVYRIQALGHFDPQRHILLDNRIFQGRAGVHALTPFVLSNGSTILVNRGWLLLAPDRRSLPAVPTDSGQLLVSGILKKPTGGGPRLGDPDILLSDRWPQLVTYLDLDSVSTALGTSLEPWLLQLDKTDPAGFKDRQWKAAVMTPEVHRAYAIQWFSLALATVIIWLAIGWRRGKNTMTGHRPTE